MFSQQVRDVLAVKIAQVDDADFTAEACHIVDDFFRLCFAEGEFVVVDVEFFHHVHEGLDGERVVLRRNGKAFLLLFFLAVAFENGSVVVVKFVCAGDEFFAFWRECHTAACAIENRNADFVFEIVNGCCQRRLGNE